MVKSFWNDRFEHLSHLSESVLFDLARNDAAELTYRLTAVEIMLKKGFKRVNHPELTRFRELVEQEQTEAKTSIPVVEHESEVENDSVSPVKVENSGAPSASVTTKTMFSQEIVHFPDED